MWFYIRSMGDEVSEIREEDMINETDSRRNAFTEDRLSKARKNKRAMKVKSVLIMVGCLVIMVAVMYATAAICTWIDGQMQEDAMDAAVALGIKDESGNNLDEKGNIVDDEGNIVVNYSQEQLDAQVAAARAEAEAEVLAVLRQGITEGESMIQALRGLYKDELIVSSGGKYHFVPINRDLKQNQLKQENLNILESGEYQYIENGQIVSYKGIDVSKHQGEINWAEVAGDGVTFAFVRVGYRGYGAAGRLVEDEYFEKNIEEALSAGIKVGVYFYTQATTEEEAAEEANFVLERIAPYKIECPVVIDVEMVSGAEGRMDNLSTEERTKVVLKFCQTIEAAGYKPMIYHNMEVGALKVNLNELENYDKWFASYSERLYYPYEYKVWQYSQSGSVAGIRGNVDLNISFGPLWE